MAEGKLKNKKGERKSYFALALILNLNVEEQTDNLGKTYKCNQK